MTDCVYCGESIPKEREGMYSVTVCLNFLAESETVTKQCCSKGCMKASKKRFETRVSSINVWKQS